VVQSSAELPQVEVCCVVLRAVFNYLRYDARVPERSLNAPQPSPRHRARVAAAAASGRAVKALFDLVDRDGETVLARTFDVVNADGSIGIWGKRDPKWLRVSEEAWIAPRDRDTHSCTSCRLYNERHGRFDAAPSPCADSSLTV
jgi:hypothetical protein